MIGRAMAPWLSGLPALAWLLCLGAAPAQASGLDGFFNTPNFGRALGTGLLMDCMVGPPPSCGTAVNASHPLPTADNALMAATAASGITPPLAITAYPQTFQDEPATALSASGNTGIINHSGASISPSISITNVTTGGNLELDICPDGTPASCYQIWGGDFYANATTINFKDYPLSGPYRWAWTIGGGASLTLAITATHGQTAVPVWYAQYPTAFNSTAVGSASGTMQMAGCSTLMAAIKLGTGTTPPVLQPYISLDGKDWFAAGGTVTPTASTTTPYSAPTNGYLGAFFQWKVATAGNTTNSELYWYCR